MVVFKLRDSVPSASYSSICNVLHQWSISLIPTYRVYRLYDYVAKYNKYNNIHLIIDYRELVSKASLLKIMLILSILSISKPIFGLVLAFWAFLFCFLLIHLILYFSFLL